MIFATNSVLFLDPLAKPKQTSFNVALKYFDAAFFLEGKQSQLKHSWNFWLIKSQPSVLSD